MWMRNIPTQYTQYIHHVVLYIYSVCTIHISCMDYLSILNRLFIHPVWIIYPPRMDYLSILYGQFIPPVWIKYPSWMDILHFTLFLYWVVKFCQILSTKFEKI
uniref:Uncharacterized protein n=1 Tax=Cacopsylla melanoneura TaxID=428564 RepID=A0A8D9ADX0_9HEMI